MKSIMPSKEDILILEAPDSQDVPLIKKFIDKGCDVRTFDFEMDLKQNAIFKEFLLNSKIKRLFLKPYTPGHVESIAAANKMEPIIMRSPEYRAFRDLYLSDDMIHIFQKFVVSEISNFSYIRYYLKDVALENPGKKIYFVSSDYLLWSKLYSQYLPDVEFPSNVEIIVSPARWSRLWRCWKQKCLIVGYVSVVGFAALLGGIFSFFKPKKKESPYSMWVGARFEVDHAGDRGYDLLIDGKDFRNDNMLFIDAAGLDEQVLARERSKGREFLEFKKELNPLSLIRRRWHIGFLWRILICCLRSFWWPPQSQAWSNVYFIAMKAFFDWSILSQLVDIKNLISTNQEHAKMSCLHILLRVSGGTSWNYSCYIGGGYISAKDGNWDEVKNIGWAFLLYDHFIGFNEDVISYNQSHGQSVKFYHAVGSLYSQPVFLKKGAREELLGDHFPQVSDKEDKKIVAVFDTTFFDSVDMLTNYEDCLAFYRDMEKLLSMREDILLVFKPSKNLTCYCHPDHPVSCPERGNKVAMKWREISKHPRVAWMSDLTVTPKTALNFAFNSLILAGSDVIITHCMSSPTAEALGARKKSFWYESGTKHAGSDYDKIPGLCVHGFDDLLQRVDELLYKTSDEEYDAYLDKYIKGKIEYKLDGLAITRFRQLLKDTNDKGKEN